MYNNIIHIPLYSVSQKKETQIQFQISEKENKDHETNNREW